MPPLCLVARGGGAFMWAAPRPWGLTRGGQQHAVLPRGPVSSLRQTGVGAAGRPPPAPWPGRCWDTAGPLAGVPIGRGCRAPGALGRVE